MLTVQGFYKPMPRLERRKPRILYHEIPPAQACFGALRGDRSRDGRGRSEVIVLGGVADNPLESWIELSSWQGQIETGSEYLDDFAGSQR
jgi:hypothetical protein